LQQFHDSKHKKLLAEKKIKTTFFLTGVAVADREAGLTTGSLLSWLMGYGETPSSGKNGKWRATSIACQIENPPGW